MKNSYKQFLKLLNDLQQIDSLYNYVSSQKIPIDADDLLRWQWVQSISALDKLVHDLVRIGIVDEFQGKRSITKKYKTIKIDIPTYESMKSDPQNATVYFELMITTQLGFQSYQDPKKIADALSYVWDENNKWDALASGMNMNSKDCKIFLNNIIKRRNQIVHQGDYVDPFSRAPIYYQDVSDVIVFIKDLGLEIFNAVK